MKRDVYQIITDRIIQLLESGTVPWHQPWKSATQWPQNLVSRKHYRGINTFLLSAARYASPYWLTMRQVNLLGGKVKKGEKAFPVVFWKIFREEGENDEIKRVPFLRYYSVFNVAQCEGINTPTIEVAGNPNFEPIARCEQVVSEMPKRPVINHAHDRACYHPSLDTVTMPEAKLFKSGEHYYSTLFHELVHATGHVSRLNRKEVAEPDKFGTDPYSREELVAEMGAAFMCGHCDIENHTVEYSASYIQHWLERLKGDRKLVVLAAAQAQKACDFILDVKYTEAEGPAAPTPAKEFKVVALRDCPLPESMQLCDTPERAADYWRMHVATHPYFDSECECFVVLLLNTRRRVKGHQLISIGTMDTILIHAREVFRCAVIGSAAAVVLMHNHPSGDPTPSEADIKVTRDLIRAGQLMKIEVLDHVVMGNPRHQSLRELGYFY
jgi:antirestriction protein ArdC